MQWEVGMCWAGMGSTAGMTADGGIEHCSGADMGSVPLDEWASCLRSVAALGVVVVGLVVAHRIGHWRAALAVSRLWRVWATE